MQKGDAEEIKGWVLAPRYSVADGNDMTFSNVCVPFTAVRARRCCMIRCSWLTSASSTRSTATSWGRGKADTHVVWHASLQGRCISEHALNSWLPSWIGEPRKPGMSTSERPKSSQSPQFARTKMAAKTTARMNLSGIHPSKTPVLQTIDTLESAQRSDLGFFF